MSCEEPLLILLLFASASALPFALTMGIAMTARTILDVGDPFLAVLGNDVRHLMLMAAIAGVAFVIAAKVAGRAARVVMAVEREEAAMIECGGLPASSLVTS